MKSVPKLIKRFVGILMLGSLVILFMNFIILAIIAATQAPNGSPWKTAEPEHWRGRRKCAARRW